METWKKVWREAVAPLMPTKGLEALRHALVNNDPRLLQAMTAEPPPLMFTQDWNVEGACLIGYCGWHGNGLETVGEVEEFFARACFDADQALGEPAAVRWLINFWDETPREEMFRLMLPEVIIELDRRSKLQETSSEDHSTHKRV